MPAFTLQRADRALRQPEGAAELPESILSWTLHLIHHHACVMNVFNILSLRESKWRSEISTFWDSFLFGFLLSLKRHDVSNPVTRAKLFSGWFCKNLQLNPNWSYYYYSCYPFHTICVRKLILHMKKHLNKLQTLLLFWWGCFCTSSSSLFQD